MLRFELTDLSGRFQCALYGKAVRSFQLMFDKVSEGLPVVVLQFARIVRDGGSIVVQSVKDITPVFVNPDFEEASRSRMRDLLAKRKRSKKVKKIRCCHRG